MKIQEQHGSDIGEFRYDVLLEFKNLSGSSDFEEPVEGVIKINLSNEFPFPVSINIKPDMIDGKNKNASYAEFQTLERNLNSPEESPAKFSFITESAPHDMMYGAKVYSFKTNNFNPETETSPSENPEIIEHHIAIPTAQRVHFISNVLNRIVDENAGSSDIKKMMEVYDKEKSSAIDKFYNDIKKYANFEYQIKTLDFLIGEGIYHRSHSDTINKVAKEITKERLGVELESIDDVENFVSIINSHDNLPNITKREVFVEVYQRKQDEKGWLQKIGDKFGITDWDSLSEIE